jgi:ABC-type lipopolysaccharide export system ATPase subunit
MVDDRHDREPAMSTDAAPIRVLLADDHAVVRKGIREFLEMNGTIQVIAEANNGDAAFEGVREHRPDVAVLDIQKIIGFLKAREIGVLITDHNVRETLGICDRAYIINEGRVLASGAPGDIVYNEDVRKVYLGEHFRL